MRCMRCPVTLLALVSAALASSRGLAAQDPSVRRADSLLARGDSAAAMQVLGEAVLRSAKDAALWHRIGLLAWQLSGAERQAGSTRRPGDPGLRVIADSALRRAVALAPRNPTYLADLGHFYRTSNSAWVRGKAPELFERALQLARKSGDGVARSRAADGLGMIFWRRYEDKSDRNIYSFIVRNVKDRSFTQDPRSIAFFVDNAAKRAAAQDWSGQREYLRAHDYFAEALRADPDHGRALRHLSMALADRQRWLELLHVARARNARRPRDPWAWLIRGLASHRLHDDRDAAAAFETALTLLPEGERHYLDRTSRIMTGKDSASQAFLPVEERVTRDRMYWLLVDPLWATPDNEHRLEFLSRVVFADLRFSVDELGVRGADTDRGEVFIRYGPPPVVISFPIDPLKTPEHRISSLWWYSTDATFLFRAVPSFGIARLDPADARTVRMLRDTVPVTWTNVATNRELDTIAVQVARFRGGALHSGEVAHTGRDSADVFVAAELPVGDLVQGIDLRQAAVRIEFQAFTWRAQPVFRRTSSDVISLAAPDAGRVRTWQARLHPGVFAYRVEALQPDAMRAARASGRIEVAPSRGFGLSDILVADRVTPKSDGPAERWRDFVITPNAGRVRAGQPVALLWETYGLTNSQGRNRYQVAITLAVARPESSPGVAARIVSGLAAAVGISGSGPDQVLLSFVREAPARPLAVEHVTVDLSSAPAGEYSLAIEVTDLATNLRARRERTISIVR